jgi:hypothetical protein
VRFDLGLEVVFLPWLHRAGQYQRRRSGAGGGDCAVGPFSSVKRPAHNR